MVLLSYLKMTCRFSEAQINSTVISVPLMAGEAKVSNHRPVLTDLICTDFKFILTLSHILQIKDEIMQLIFVRSWSPFSLLDSLDVPKRK